MLASEHNEDVLNWFDDRSKEISMELKARCAHHYYRSIRQSGRNEGRRLSFEKDGTGAMTRGCLAGSGVCSISRRDDVQPRGYLPPVAGNVLRDGIKKVRQESGLFLPLRDAGSLGGKSGACGFRAAWGDAVPEPVMQQAAALMWSLTVCMIRREKAHAAIQQP